MSQTVAENETAVFNCSIDAGVQHWFVNGSEVDSNSNPDFHTTSAPASGGGPPVHTLSIVARCDYNGIRVECHARFPNMESEDLVSCATLTIQGTCL